MSFFGIQFKRNKVEISIREGVGSVWHYHLAEGSRTLCGDTETMPTGLPLNTWGMKTHIHETYCKACDKIGRERGFIYN